MAVHFQVFGSNDPQAFIAAMVQQSLNRTLREIVRASAGMHPDAANDPERLAAALRNALDDALSEFTADPKAFLLQPPPSVGGR